MKLQHLNKIDDFENIFWLFDCSGPKWGRTENEQLVWGKAPAVPLIYKQGHSTSVRKGRQSRFISRRQQSHTKILSSPQQPRKNKKRVESVLHPTAAIPWNCSPMWFICIFHSRSAFSWSQARTRRPRERSLSVCACLFEYSKQSLLSLPPATLTHTHGPWRASINFMARKENDWMSNSGHSHQSWLINQSSVARGVIFMHVVRKKGWRVKIMCINPTKEGVKIALCSIIWGSAKNFYFRPGDVLLLIDFVTERNKRDADAPSSCWRAAQIRLRKSSSHQGSLRPQPWPWPAIVIYGSIIWITKSNIATGMENKLKWKQ